MKCDICGIQIDSVENAIDDGWDPFFYEGEVEHGPVCPSCSEKMLRFGDDGQMELKGEYRCKVQFVDGDYSSKPSQEELEIDIFMTEENAASSNPIVCEMKPKPLNIYKVNSKQ